MWSSGVDVDAPHVAMHPDHGRQAGRKVQVGSLVLDAECKQLGNIHESLSLSVRLAHGCRSIMTTIRNNLQSVRAADRRGLCSGATRRERSHAARRVQDLRPRSGARGACRRARRPSARTTSRKRWRRWPCWPDLPLQWHCIGPIQSNKTRLVAAHFDWAHTVDRLKIAQRLSEQRPEGMAAAAGVHPGQYRRRRQQGGRGARRSAGPGARSGAAAAACTLRGLMTIPEPAEDFAAQKAVHLRARALFDELARGRAGAGHPVHGHDRRSRGGHRGGQHHGAGGDGDFRRGEPDRVSSDYFFGGIAIGLMLPQSEPSHLPPPSMFIFSGLPLDS